MGTEKEDFVKLSQRIGRQTGGIFPSTFTSAMRRQEGSSAWLFLRGKATVQQTADLLTILRDVLLTVKLDNQERFRQMVLKAKAGKEAGLIPGGNSVVNARLRAYFNEADWLAEQMGGVSNLFFLRQLAESVVQDWPAVQEKLEAIRQILINRPAMLCNVTLDAANWERFEPQLNDFLAAFPADPTDLSAWAPPLGPIDEGLTIPAQVNYVGKGADLYRLGYRLHGSSAVIAKYLRTTWLWEKVRVQGGAYSSACNFDRRSGVLSFVSYRDPNLLATLDVYDQTGHFLRQRESSQAELNKSIIGAIGALDAYQLPDAKGYTSMIRYLLGESDEERQQFRDEVLSTSPADFLAFADVLDQVKEAGVVVVMGAPEAIKAADESRGGWLAIQKVM
jgi:Zn-dependent M16 (insulinase) family peptidase